MKKLSLIGKWMLIFVVASSLAGCNSGTPTPAPSIKSPAAPVLTTGVANAISLADGSRGITAADDILLKAVPLAKTTDDFIALARVTKSYTARNDILIACAEKCTNIDDILRVTGMLDEIRYFPIRNTILLNSVKLTRNIDDCKRLAKEATAAVVRNQILTLGAEKYVTGGNSSDDQSVKLAYEAMQKSQKAYTDAITNGETGSRVLELNKTYQEKKAAYEAIKPL